MRLRSWLSRHRGQEPVTEPRLVPAGRIVAAYRAGGGDGRAALQASLAQVRGLQHEVADGARWEALADLIARIGDPWNADDWPLGFDALLLCVPLCTDVDYECVRCPIGKLQDDMSCTHPSTHFGRVGELLRHHDREGLRAHLAHIESVLLTLIGP